jgi:cobalt-zinc-cadmium efflux system membrane fusion protein
VYVPLDAHTFRRLEVRGGQMIPPNQQEIIRGVRPGERVLANALLLENTSDQ